MCNRGKGLTIAHYIFPPNLHGKYKFQTLSPISIYVFIEASSSLYCHNVDINTKKIFLRPRWMYERESWPCLHVM